MRRIAHCGVIVLALLSGTALALAQQSKTQQNSADEALTKSAPEAKQAPQAPPQTAPTQASQPGLDPSGAPLLNGMLTAPGASPDGQTVPAKFSARNAAKDKEPLVSKAEADKTVGAGGVVQ